MQTQIPVTLLDLFKFIGSPVFIGGILAFLLEGIGPFQNLTATVKRLWVIGLILVLSLLSYALTTFVPASVVQALDPVYAYVISSFIALFGSQVWHKIFKPVTETYIFEDEYYDDEEAFDEDDEEAVEGS